MGTYGNQKRIHQFFVRHFRSQRSFTQSEMAKTTSWTIGTLKTYWPKQFSGLVISAGGDAFRVSEAFRPYIEWREFQSLVSQVRRVSSDYLAVVYPLALIYEFYMPLTDESHLRWALDSLFYKDTIMARLKAQHRDQLLLHFERRRGEAMRKYWDRLCEWIAGKFGGYSITHVNGRFRAGELASLEQAQSHQIAGRRYLVDETTAVVRFIFPCGLPASAGSTEPSQEDLSLVGHRGNDLAEEVERIRWFFGKLFVESIVQVVNGQEEIWMIEIGMGTRLHIWKRAR